MATFFALLLLVSVIGLCVGLLSPSFVSKVMGRQVSRKQVAAIFGGLSIFFFVMVGVFAPPVPKSETIPSVAHEPVATQPIEEAPAPTTTAQTESEATSTISPAVDIPSAQAVQPTPSAPSQAATLSDPIPVATPVPTPAPIIPSPAAQSEGPAVKKSTTGICHQKGTRYYNQTKNYTAYATLQACLDSGGRMPK